MFIPADEDFVPIETNLIFDEGLDLMQCLYVPILNDECLEDNEYFTITLSSEQDCVLFYNDSFEATIIDDDCTLSDYVHATVCVCICLSAYSNSTLLLSLQMS